MALVGTHAEQELLGNGRVHLTLHTRPIAYRDGGVLKRIVNDFVSGDANFPHIVTAAPMMVSVGSDGMRRIHPTREADRYMEIGAPYIKPATTWQKVSLGSATRSGNTITWSTAQADVRVTMAGHYVKLDIPLKNGWVPPGNQVAFPVGLTGLTRSGGNILRDGVVVCHLRPPDVYDAANTLDRRPIDYQFVTVASQPYLLLTLPSLAGMSQPVIDPTINLQPDGANGIDTAITSSSPDTNWGTGQTMWIGEANNEANAPVRVLIKFNLTTLPAAAIVTSATLSLWATADLSSNARTGRVYRQLRAWVETQATWNVYSTGNSWATAGGFGAADCEQVDIGTAAIAASGINEWKVFTLTPTTKAGLDLGNGWLVKVDTETDDRFAYSSSDNANAAQRPKLDITYYLTPTITLLNPDHGYVGGSIVITGTNFEAAQGAGTVTINGVAATVTAWSDVSITVTVAAGTTTGDVIVTNNSGGVSAAGTVWTLDVASAGTRGAAILGWPPVWA